MRFDVFNNNTAKTYWIESDYFSPEQIHQLEDILRDPIDETLLDPFLPPQYKKAIQVSFKPGVTDNSAKALEKVLHQIWPDKKIKVATGTTYFYTDEPKELNYNPLIQNMASIGTEDFFPQGIHNNVHLSSKPIRTFDLATLSIEELMNLSRENVWALSKMELIYIKEYFIRRETIDRRRQMGLSAEVSDIEMEVIAQTWSEHCKHKIFNAKIEYTEESPDLGSFTVDSVFKSHIASVTKEINKDWLVSVFSDNAGIVRFGEKNDYCLKVETHNSPSALDPYGGALTGILGVNRDILGCGLGAEPIANTNVLCFGSQKYDDKTLEQLPSPLKKPTEVLKGVHRGIEDGGNKSGIPTVNGAMTFHDNYAGKPLVYCGTLGVIPQEIKGAGTFSKNQKPGDYIVVCGGSVGADGIHGATFSSQELDEHSPSTAVQIGDPFTQKKLTDFILGARDQRLYRGITDNGAGGLSSSIGEMAELTNGAEIDLSKVPLKYPGLSPFEIVISESQERMSFAVEPEKLNDFLELAKEYDVNPAVIGNFHDRGSFDIKQDNILLASLDLHFLHESLPQMKLKAHFQGAMPESTWYEKSTKPSLNLKDKIISAMKDENIASKQKWVEQFDHEVKAATLSKPFIHKKQSGPTDAAVLWQKMYGDDEKQGISLGCGMAPHFSHLDTYFMTIMSVDEAVRNLISVGTDPGFIALCDNYCWPDPIASESNPDGEHKLAQLVRSTAALKDIALAYQTPFISGKDSMKNDFIGLNPAGKTTKISIPPTLLITGVGKVPHIDRMVSSDFKAPGDLIFYIGQKEFSHLTKSTMNPDSQVLPRIELEQNWFRHQLISKLIQQEILESCHDVSDGGAITSIVESCFPNNLGAKLSLSTDLDAFCFNELPASYIVSVTPENKDRFLGLVGINALRVGTVTAKTTLNINEEIFSAIDDLYSAWRHDD